MNGSIFEVVIIGAGQAGLSASYYLKHLGLDHVIFDRGRIGETWRSQRWDSFRMVTMNKLNILPGASLKSRQPEQFGSAGEFVTSLQEYVSAHQLPVSESSNVLAIEKSDGSPVFNIRVMHDNEIVRTYDAWQVIIASGAMNEMKIPAIASRISPAVNQLHSGQYRSALQLTNGAVLVVGAGQSGCEIAQDLLLHGRKVYLSCRPHASLPRNYRGKDIIDWLIQCKTLDTNDPAPTAVNDPVIENRIDDETILNLNTLSMQGAVIAGSVKDASGTTLTLHHDVGQVTVKHDADTLRIIDDFINANQIEAPSDENDTPAQSKALTVLKEPHLRLEDHNINTIVWATGPMSNFDYIKLPVLDEDGRIRHDRGITNVDGLYVVGIPGLKARKAGYIFGVKDDAGLVTNKIYGTLR